MLQFFILEITSTPLLLLRLCRWSSFAFQGSNPVRFFTARRWPIVLAILGFLSCLSCADQQGENRTRVAKDTPREKAAMDGRNEVTPPQIWAEKILKDYASNEIAADQTYKGKQVFIVGRIVDIKKDLLDTPYVTLKSLSGSEFRRVQAFFDDDKLAELAKLRKDQIVGVIGRCDGLMVNVLIKDSRLIVINEPWAQP